MRVLVTGGKGDLGRRLSPWLDKAGHEVLTGTRTPTEAGDVHFEFSPGPDVGSLEGVDALVHLASDPFHSDQDVEGSGHLWEVAREAGVVHAVYVSIVGIDDHPFRYYQAKRRIERQLLQKGPPHTILRATQFHSFIPRLVDEIGGRLRMVLVPTGIRVQPVDADAVAERLADLVDRGPSGRVPDIAGPEVLSLDAMVHDYLRATGRRWPRVRLPMGGRTVQAFRAGLHLAPNAEVVGVTYGEYLEQL